MSGEASPAWLPCTLGGDVRNEAGGEAETRSQRALWFKVLRMLSFINKEVEGLCRTLRLRLTRLDFPFRKVVPAAVYRMA